tara:strand:- start:253 stop:1470 length:1218 start_codon:yes stop_codon:yes gene_type:complete
MKKIAIIGGGISGLYFANLLEKNKNYDYKILEKKSFQQIYLKGTGYGVQLSPNSIELLNKIGFKKIPSRETYFPKQVNFYNAKNCKKICEIDLRKFNNGDNKYTTLNRHTLHSFLKKKIPSEKIILGTEIWGDIKCEKNIFDLNYRTISMSPFPINLGGDGRSHLASTYQEQFNYLIASDGVFSKTRSKIFEKKLEPAFNGTIALRGHIFSKNISDISIYLGSNFHFVVYPYDQFGNCNFVSIIKKNLSVNEFRKLNDYNDYDFMQKFSLSLKDEIANKTSFKIENIIEPRSFLVYVSHKLETPKKDKVFFVGDALYTFPPSFAQGASQSIESSYEAFEAIENNSTKYYAKRSKRINSVYLRSKLNQFVFHLSNPAIVFFRNIILRKLTKNKKFLENYLGKIYKN